MLRALADEKSRGEMEKMADSFLGDEPPQTMEEQEGTLEKTSGQPVVVGVVVVVVVAPAVFGLVLKR